MKKILIIGALAAGAWYVWTRYIRSQDNELTRYLNEDANNRARAKVAGYNTEVVKDLTSPSRAQISPYLGAILVPGQGGAPDVPLEYLGTPYGPIPIGVLN